MEKQHLGRWFGLAIAFLSLLGMAGCSDTVAPDTDDDSQSKECVWINGELFCTGPD